MKSRPKALRVEQVVDGNRFHHETDEGVSPLYVTTTVVRFTPPRFQYLTFREARANISGLTRDFLVAHATGHFSIEDDHICFDNPDDAVLCQMKFS